jgi:hypothetical protein
MKIGKSKLSAVATFTAGGGLGPLIVVLAKITHHDGAATSFAMFTRKLALSLWPTQWVAWYSPSMDFQILAVASNLALFCWCSLLLFRLVGGVIVVLVTMLLGAIVLVFWLPFLLGAIRPYTLAALAVACVVYCSLYLMANRKSSGVSRGFAG